MRNGPWDTKTLGGLLGVFPEPRRIEELYFGENLGEVSSWYEISGKEPVRLVVFSLMKMLGHWENEDSDLPGSNLKCQEKNGICAKLVDDIHARCGVDDGPRERVWREDRKIFAAVNMSNSSKICSLFFLVPRLSRETGSDQHGSRSGAQWKDFAPNWTCSVCEANRQPGCNFKSFTLVSPWEPGGTLLFQNLQ